MKILPIILLLPLIGCSTVRDPAPIVDGLAPKVAPRPMAPVTVDCNYATHMAADLEQIIRNPGGYNKLWDPAFNEIAGTQTAQQRLSSAKTVLWTLRTRCPGF